MKIIISLIPAILIFMVSLSNPFHSMAKDKNIEGMVFIKGGCYQMGDTFGDGENDEKPVHEICVDDVQEFINKLNQKTGMKYRLPTEAEWEYAARSGGRKEKFAGFSEANDVYQYANFCDSNCEFDWKEDNQNDGYKNISPVKQYKPNGVRLYDMTGNVWEWCSDWYNDRYYNESLKDNPKGASSGQYKVY